MVQWQENGKTIRMQEHRWLYAQVNGPIPKGYVIHHVDHNKLNNDLSNLQCMTTRDHVQHHRAAEGKQTHQILAANAADYRREHQRQRRAANPGAHAEYMRCYRAQRKLELAGGAP
jgi:hypothetical protein